MPRPRDSVALRAGAPCLFLCSSRVARPHLCRPRVCLVLALGQGDQDCVDTGYRSLAVGSAQLEIEVVFWALYLLAMSTRSALLLASVLRVKTGVATTPAP